MRFRAPDQLLLPFDFNKTISVRRAAEMLHVSRDTICRLAQQGAFDAYQITPVSGSPYRIYYDSFITFVENIHKRSGLDQRF